MARTQETRAEKDAFEAWSYAINCVINEEQAAAGRHPGYEDAEEVIASYTSEVYEAMEGDAGRLYAAARQACIDAAEEVAFPGRWSGAIRTVDLCRRAAQRAEQGLGPR